MKTVQLEDYLPRPARVVEVRRENEQIKSFGLRFVDPEGNAAFAYQPGQFVMVSLPHCGEAPISLSSSPARPGMIRLSVRKAGRLTAAMHELREGAVIGLRGPYGRPFPMAELGRRDLLFVAGGIGLAPLASVISTCLADPQYQGSLTLLYGSRTPGDMAFQDDIKAWQAHPAMRCLLTVDQAETGWQGHVGLVTSLLDQAELAPATQSAVLCGPPLMIRAVMADLTARGFADQDIITTLERHMKCGVGVCRHCHLDGKLVCVDGPVFSLAQLRKMQVMEISG
jgi:NAD(P)H-flavin reductase